MSGLKKYIFFTVLRKKILLFNEPVKSGRKMSRIIGRLTFLIKHFWIITPIRKHLKSFIPGQSIFQKHLDDRDVIKKVFYSTLSKKWCTSEIKYLHLHNENNKLFNTEQFVKLIQNWNFPMIIQ
jgi:hypothetical protein